MATITFRRNSASITVDAWASRTWQLPVTGEPGRAEIRLPHTSPAASATYIDDEGNSWLEIASEGGCGKWIGIIRELQFGESDIRIIVEQPWGLFGDRVIPVDYTRYDRLPAGYYVQEILLATLVGVPWFWWSTFDYGSDPIIQSLEYVGQDAWGLLLDLMDQALCELQIDAETGQIRWRGALAGDQRAQQALIAGGNFLGWSYRVVGSRVAEVSVKRGRERYWARSGTAAARYPGQKIVTASFGQDLATVANDELARATGATLTIEGGVPASLWSLREGMFPTVFVPQAGFGGREHPCRVLARTISDDSELMMLGLQVLDPVVGVRVPPPMRSGGQATAGSKGKGSFAQRQRADRRFAWNSHLRES